MQTNKMKELFACIPTKLFLIFRLKELFQNSITFASLEEFKFTLLKEFGRT